MKPTIYLGLGGTGNLAVAQAKKLYEEEYGKGNIPASIAFVTLDFQTDMDEDPDLATDIKDDFIRIEAAVNPREFLRIRKENNGQFAWMFDGNVGSVDNRISKGAKAVRTTGRLYTEIALDKVMSRFDVIKQRVTNIDVGAQMTGGINIHMVMSLAGGTGAGSFLTIANALREKYSNTVNIYGYGVTHGIFRAMDPMGVLTPNVELNTISSIIDLDQLQSASQSNPVELELGSRKIVLREPVFDNFSIVDNISESGHVLSSIKSLCEVVGTCLYAYGNEAGDKVENVLNNVGWKEGGYNVGAKIGWAQGIGACRVVYKGKLMAETYALQAAIELIRQLRQEGSNIHTEAVQWTQAVEIREDGQEYNLLIDSIYSPQRLQSLPNPLVDYKQTDAANKDVVNTYINRLVDFPTEENLANRTEALVGKLNEKINGYLASTNGVGNAIKFLNSLHGLCEKYISEMTDEALTISNKLNDAIQKFNTSAFADYEDHKYGKFSFKQSKNQDLLDDHVGLPAKAILQQKIEVARREAARGIFSKLDEEIRRLQKNLANIDGALQVLSSRYESRLVSIQGASQDALVFEYDLSYQERVNMKVNPDHISTAMFAESLPSSLLEMSADKIDEAIMGYTTSLDVAREYREKLIVDVIDNLSDADYANLKLEIARKSALWLSVNDRGQCVLKGGEFTSVADVVAKNWLVSMYKSDKNKKSRLECDKSFLQNVTKKDFLAVDSESTKQQMLVCRVDGAVIPYCLSMLNDAAMERYERVVRSSIGGDAVFNPHFDKTIFDTMVKTGYKLKPEMKDEALFYWVCGHLFGWDTIKEEARIMKQDEKENIISEASKEIVDHTKYVRCLRKKYMFWNPKAADGKDKKWVILGSGGGTKRRDTAYTAFKTVVLPEYKDEFKKVVLGTYSQQKAFWDSEIQRLISAGIHNYINTLVCSDKNSLTYMDSNDGELKQIQAEWEYIENSLLNALANLR